MAHLVPEGKGIYIAHHRDIVVGSQQHPVALFGHAEDADGRIIALSIPGFNGVLLLIEVERTLTAQLDADVTIEAVGRIADGVGLPRSVVDNLHRARNLGISINLGIGIDDDDGQVGGGQRDVVGLRLK